MRWYIVILHHLLRLAGRLPLRWLHGIGAAIGWSIWALHATPRHRARVSLSLAITLNGDETRQALLRPALIEFLSAVQAPATAATMASRDRVRTVISLGVGRAGHSPVLCRRG